MRYSLDDPRTWPAYKPLIIAHDVGRSRDRSTAVVGGNSPIGQRLLGIEEALELPAKLVGSARASALAAIDRKHDSNALIVADVSSDDSYAEDLFETFGRRVIGLHITRHGDGLKPEQRPVRGGQLPVYTIGRTYLLNLLHDEWQAGLVKFADSQMMRRAYAQLANLQTELRDTGVVYSCPPGQHDNFHRHAGLGGPASASRILAAQPARVTAAAQAARKIRLALGVHIIIVRHGEISTRAADPCRRRQA
jgi:hypothetical protein